MISRFMMPRLLVASLVNRRLSIGLTLLTLTLSVALFLSVVRLQQAARDSFEGSVSGVDLILSARGGDLPILLYSVFRLGNATRNITWESYVESTDDDRIAWTVPISLGDSHRGYRVIGTNTDYFTRMRRTDRGPLAFERGAAFDDLFDVVLGARVARDLGYDLGTQLILSHGVESVGAADHDGLPFTVVGILAPTGTPIDRAVHVSLEAIEAIHVGWESGRQITTTPAEQLRARDNRPQAITAAFVGLENRARLFQVQRSINRYDEEPLSAVAPGLALAQLWNLVGAADRVLRLVAGLVLLVSLVGLMASTVASLSVRRREMAIYRGLGASPLQIAGFQVIEAMAVGLVATLIGWLLVQAVTAAAAGVVGREYGLLLDIAWVTPGELLFLLAIVIASALASLIPAAQLYRYSLQDGLSVRQ